MAVNLWGDLPPIKTVITPSVLMKEQAALLQEITSGLLTCEVVRNISGDTIIESLRIVAPALGNYRRTVLTVQHDAVSYPCTVSDEIAGTGRHSVADHTEFSTFLARVLGSAPVKNLIGQLLAEIHANDGS